MTVANASLHTGVYEFIFATSFRPILTANYHIHVYSSVGDGKIVTSSLNDMEGTTGNTGAYLATFFQILIEDQYHPMMQFLNFIAVGNERYVGMLEAGNLYNPHRLTLPAGYRVRCFARWNEFLAIGTWRGDTITDVDKGMVFLWDGVSDNPNTIIEVLEGGVNTMNGGGGILSIIAGYKGKLLQYGSTSAQKVTQIPLLGRTEYCEVAPGAMAIWQSILRFGSSLNTDSTAIHQGVYSWGSLNNNFPNSLGFDYPLSLGDQTNPSVRIGCIFPQGEKLYVSWQNSNTFGIDSIDTSNDVYDTATMETLITDLGKIYQLKLPLVFRVDFQPLVTGQSISVKYKADREASWKTVATEDTASATSINGIINQRIKEVQFAIDITTAGQQFTVLKNSMEVDNAAEAKGIS
jgi:hypothetical protein